MNCSNPEFNLDEVKKNSKTKWTSVFKLLPEEEKTVLLICKNGSQFVGYWKLDYNEEAQWRIWTALGSAKKLNKGRVTHWMPLPEGPEVDV